jgi:hypothetical protein
MLNATAANYNRTNKIVTKMKKKRKYFPTALSGRHFSLLWPYGLRRGSMLPPLITNRPRKCQIKKNNVKKVSKNEKNGKMKGQKKKKSSKK